MRTRLVLDRGEQVDLGHVPLHMGRNETADDDNDHSYGSGSGAVPPALESPAPVRGRTSAQISNAISSNRGGMGSINLTTDEIQAIANYLAQ